MSKELNDFLSVLFCASHGGKHGTCVCEENTKLPLLRKLPFRARGAEGKGMGMLRRSMHKISKFLLSVAMNTLEMGCLCGSVC